LIEAGEPVLGVIAVPPLSELYWAIQGGGAWRDGVRVSVRDAEMFHDQDNVCLGTNAMRAVDPRTVPGRLRNLGSACCEAVFTASGRLAACTFLGEQTHDVAAAAVIVSEAGCRFGTIEGRELTLKEFVAETPIRVPTFVAPPRRLALLMARARRLA
jgi:myo-inositol-1(or 4)-monophosphatase